ncbi:MAG: histidine decarboxylase [Proteobacteria bacterium]|nr:histidine decarboxylase [Pseudomonadota bacterium]
MLNSYHSLPREHFKRTQMDENSAELQQSLNSLYDELVEKSQTYIGYPNSQLLDNHNLSPFLNLTINNVGDPFVGNNGMNTFQQEKELLEFFGNLLKLETNDLWGYVTNGGTEGNLFGLYLARERYPDGVVFFSEESHYSLNKVVKILGLKCCIIPSQGHGEIDYSELSRSIKSLQHYPVIMNANIGTTMKGAIDNIDKIKQVLKENQISRSYLHCDGALFGTMLPLLEGAPRVDFSCGIDSIAISGHKFFGSPIPCGVVLTRKTNTHFIQNTVQYINSFDSTVSGSRDGFSVLILWQVMKKLGVQGLKDRALDCLKMTDYTLRSLRKISWPAWCNPNSNIVVIKKPTLPLIKKWHLATENNISHVILMPGIDRKKIDLFVEDLNLLKNVRPLRGEFSCFRERLYENPISNCL